MRVPGSRFIGLAALLVASCLAGCNSSMTGGSGTTTDQSATGVWSGTDSVTGDPVVGVINSGGQATFILNGGVQFAGTVDVSGTTLAATVTGYANFNQTFSDGSTYGIGTLNGTVSTGSSLTATLTFTTNGGASQTGNWSLSFETLSSSASSTAAVQGNYTDIATNATLSITSSGVMTEQNTNTGCVLNGSISTTDSSVNVYQVSYTLEDCTGTYAPLNGVQFTGLAYLDANVSPTQLVVAVAGANSTSKYAIVSDLNS
ncbi:MAG: hypothetical protein WA747_15900 [Steroidobacteraceae bacterium]